MVPVIRRPHPLAALRRLREAVPGPRDLAAALPRPNRTWAVRLWWVLVVGWVIYTGPVAYADDPIDVTGPGGLFFIPDLAGDGERLFWERYFWIEYYSFHSEANWNDPILSMLSVLAHGLMYLLVVFGATIASVTGWLFSMTTVDGMATAVGNVMGASAESTLGWLFPSMLVFGGVVTFATRNRGGEGMLGNLLWLGLAGTALILTTMHSPLLVSSVEGVRTVGADTVASMAQGANVNGTTPIVYESPDDEALEGDPSDIAARKNIDALWRTLIVTPWCLVEFGSIEACEQYGTPILTAKGEDRKNATEDAKAAQDGSSTQTWMSGMDTGYAVARVVILLIALFVAVAFTLFVLFAALTATYAMVMTYMLLIVGPLFVAMGCVPGAPRRWLQGWARQTISQLIMSLIAFMLFSVALSFIAIMFAATASMGWMLSALLTMTALVAAVTLRTRLAAIFGVGGDTGSGIGKYLLARKAMSLMRLPGGGGRRPRAPRAARDRDNAPPDPPADGGGGRGPGSAPPARTAGRGTPPPLPAARQPRALPPAQSPRQQAPQRIEHARAEGTTSQRTELARAEGRPPQQLPASPTPRTASPRAAADPAPAPQRPVGKTVRTAPAVDLTARQDQQALSGEVIPPAQPRAPQPRAQRRRPQARVRFTRPDLPDAPHLHAPRRTSYMSTAQAADRTPRSRPMPGARQPGSTPTDRPRFRAPHTV